MNHKIHLVMKRFSSILAYDYEGPKENKRVAAFMHGILGTKRNWRTPANLWRKRFPNYSCITIDHRGHGASRHVKSDQNNIQSCALDLIELFQKESIYPPEIILAHSFSGKVALQYLTELHSNTASAKLVQHPKHVFILDSIPRKYKRESDAISGSSVFRIFDLLAELPSTFESKEWMLDKLSKGNVDPTIALWIASNITTVSEQSSPTTSSKCTWAFNLTTVQQLFQSFCETDLWSIVEQYNGPGVIHFVRAGKNGAWSPEILADLHALTQKKKNIRFHTMLNVGHWIHTEDLLGLLALVETETKGDLK